MREKIKTALVNEFLMHQEFLGCYEGGSAAFGRDDEWSDIDFQIVVKDEFVEQAVQILEKAMQSVAPVEESYILPAPTWHGHWQGFYKLKDISPYLLLDVLIMKESSPSYFTEVELHGTPHIFFDKTGKLGKEHIDTDELNKIIPLRIKRIEYISKMFHLFIDKEIKRNREMDAFDLYYNLLLRSLVELLRIKYDTARWSFGCRYLSSDLPEEIYQEIKTFSYVKDLADLQHKKNAVLNYINSMLIENLTDKYKKEV
jgi:predicted nucleotidyltransferase